MIDRHDAIGGMVVKALAGQHARARAEPQVRLLQRDHVRVDLAKHGDDPVGIAAAVEADCLVNVIAGGDELHRFRVGNA